jgi:FkbM family methyltransferase
MKKIFDIFKYINTHPLAGKHRLLAYYKFLIWQISQALFPKERIVPFLKETKLAVTKGMTGATGNIYTGLHEFNDMGFLLHLLRKGDVFFDIGANIGSYTILASGFCGASTVSIEPIKATFKSLQKNILLNKIETIVAAKNIGLGKEDGKLVFTNTMDTINHVVDEHENIPEKDKIVVDVLCGDKLVDDFGSPLLIKIDVEGFESPVLDGMSLILANSNLKAIIIELNGSGNRYGFNDNDIHLKLLSHNFTAYQYNPFTRLLDMIDWPNQFNTIYVRDIEFVKERIRLAEKISIFSDSF